MTTKVTAQGVVIPKELLGNAEEVDIRKENNLIIISPVKAEDPIFQLGRNPVMIDIDDASENHDFCIVNA